MYFKNKGDMEEQMFSHVGEKPFQCLSCAKSFSSDYRLKRHGVIHTEMKAFDCSLCGTSCNNTGNLQQYIKIHTGQKSCKCSKYEQMFTWKNQLEYHMSMHMSEKYYCSMCHKSFKFRNSFLQHARKV
jgi:uncharacterized Zn-finger protein